MAAREVIHFSFVVQLAPPVFVLALTPSEPVPESPP
jgi:hypothetical protein